MSLAKLLIIVCVLGLTACGKESPRELVKPSSIASIEAVPTRSDTHEANEDGGAGGYGQGDPLPGIVADATETKKRSDTLSPGRAVRYLLTWAKQNFALSKKLGWKEAVTCVDGAVLTMIPDESAGYSYGLLFTPKRDRKFVMVYSPTGLSSVKARPAPKYSKMLVFEKFCGVSRLPDPIKLEGNDNRPELLVGYFAADTLAQLPTKDGKANGVLVDESELDLEGPWELWLDVLNLPKDAAELATRNKELIQRKITEFRPSDAHNITGHGTSDAGTNYFWVWASNQLTLNDLKVSPNETSIGAVMKDADPERGKRVCFTGSVIQISKARYVAVMESYEGLIMSSGWKVVRFYSFGSTASIAEGSHTKFCGVVMGQFHYNNSGGGQSHAISVVGMFDIPENRK